MDTSTLDTILGPDGSIARRLGERYEHRPQQLEMAAAVERAFTEGHHLLVEAGTGVGKSFAYLCRHRLRGAQYKKRVVISTHTISLQEHLIDKDIPLLRSVLSDEFTRGAGERPEQYLCQRGPRAGARAAELLFDEQRASSIALDNRGLGDGTTTGRLSSPDLPASTTDGVGQGLRRRHGNCSGKSAKFTKGLFWQGGPTPALQGGTCWSSTTRCFFSDLALRMRGQHLPESTTCSSSTKRTRSKTSPATTSAQRSPRAACAISSRRSTTPSAARDALHARLVRQRRDPRRRRADIAHGTFFERCIAWQTNNGRGNGRIHEPNWVENDLSPSSRPGQASQGDADEDRARGGDQRDHSHANKAAMTAEAIDALVSHKVADAVYWCE
jgi:ATP-dependent DNA helicase DinG